jgi:glutathione S-transferase
MGCHSRDEVIAMACQNIDALPIFLGDKPFIMGDRACSLDATAYAFLASLLWVPMSNPVKTHAEQHPQLARYCQRMKATCWA